MKTSSFFNWCSRKYNWLMYISFFLIFMYVYNISFKEYIYPNYFVIILNFIVSGVLIFCANFNYIKEYDFSSAKQKRFLILLLITFILILFRNGDLINGHYGSPFYLVYAIFLIFILSYTDKWYSIFCKVIIFFTIEHILATFFCFAFPSVYLNEIMPLFPEESIPMLIGQFNAGEIAGFTQHYSTNALYLAIGVIINVCNMKYKKGTKINYSFLAILILNIIAILLTGKRAQLFFPLISILIVMFIKNFDNIKMLLKKVLIIIIIALPLFLITYTVVPNILTPIRRTISGFENGDMFNSRMPLYELAINEFEKKPVLGQGWGNYKYIYSRTIEEKELNLMDAHSVYLQLLCELGIIGFTYFIVIFVYFIIKSVQILKGKIKIGSNISIIITFLTIHLYFLTECMFGNALYDIMVFIPYACLISEFVYITMTNNKRIEE